MRDAGSARMAGWELVGGLDDGHQLVPAPGGVLDGLPERDNKSSSLPLFLSAKDIATIPGLPQHVYEAPNFDQPARQDAGATEDRPAAEAVHGSARDSLSGYAQSAMARDEAQTSLANYADLLAGDHSVDIPQRHWSIKDSSVILSPEMEGKVGPVAQEFYDRTGRDLIVNDGYRTPADQAQRMYDKFKDGDKTTYVGPLGREIRSIYNTGIAAGTDKAAILNRIGSKIGEQMTNGHLVSQHLVNQAVDFRDRDLTAPQKGILGGIIRSNAGIALPEGIPRHTHASFPSRKR